MREEDILKMIKDSADPVVVPESLEPEQMMKRLKEMDLAEKRRKPLYWKYGTAAAALLIGVSLLAAGRGRLTSGDSIQLPAAETEAMAGDNVEDDMSGSPGRAMEEAKYRAESYDEVYDKFQELRKEQEKLYGESSDDGVLGWLFDGNRSTGAALEGAVEETAAAATEAFDEAPQSAGVKDSFSETNIQVEGVDEGDVVKTDGIYIYVASANLGTIRIIRPDGEKMEFAGVIPDTSTVDSSRYIQEFYLNGTQLTVVRSSYEMPAADSAADMAPGSSAAPYHYGYMPGKAVTWVETYDLTDPKTPKLSGTVVQDGYYKSSRRSGDYVYIFTVYDSDVSADRDEVGAYVPSVNKTIIPADCIYIPENIDNYSYLVVSAVDMMAPGEPVETKAIAAAGEQYYVSRENIYAASSQYDFRANQYDYTEIMKLSYKDGRIRFAAHGHVNGYLNNQFSMDEHEGNLRLVSTLSRNNGKDTNSLYVLDENLEKIGAIDNLAPDEQIYSARFMGDMGYFVTFRNMDPLFSADLSDPKNPKILGELKITGFSEYLHPYMDDLLLGIGREINPDTTNFEGLKLSMFDTSDPKSVKEVQKLVEESYENSPAWYNHKSVLISPARNLIGFSVESYDYDKREWSIAYAVYSYDREEGFRQELSAELDSTEDYSMTRGLYIGEWLYVVENSRINVYSLTDFTHGGVLTY